MKQLELKNKEISSERIDDNLSEMSYLDALPYKAPTDKEMSRNDSIDFDKELTEKKDSKVSLAAQGSNQKTDSQQNEPIDFFKNDTASDVDRSNSNQELI